MIRYEYEEDHAEVSILRSSDQMVLANEPSAPLSSQVWRHWQDLLRSGPKDQKEEDLVDDEKEGVDITTDPEGPRT